MRKKGQILQIGGFLLILVIPYVMPVPAFHSGFNPLPCGPTKTIAMTVAYNDAGDPAGSFAVLGCVYPYGTVVEVSFRVARCIMEDGTDCSSMTGLPATDILSSRSTDGHWHKSYILSLAGAQVLDLEPKATNLAYGSTAFYRNSQGTRIVTFYRTQFWGPDSTSIVPGNRTNPYLIASRVWDWWSFSDAPSGSITVWAETPFFQNGVTDPTRTFHLKIWFTNHNGGGCVPTLPCTQDEAWIGHNNCVLDGHCSNRNISNGPTVGNTFVVPVDHGLDEAVPNLNIHLFFPETNDGTVVTVWYHKLIQDIHIEGDMNSDCMVNALDLAILALNYGSVDASMADLNRDGTVNSLDLAILALNYGAIC